MRGALCLLQALLGFLLLHHIHGCVHKFGDPLDTEVMPYGHFNYKFAGLDWTGACANGTKQSPINIPSKASSFLSIPESFRTHMTFGSVKSDGENVKVYNNGAVIQVEWDDDLESESETEASIAVPETSSSLASSLSLGQSEINTRPAARYPIKPLQFHFHTHSEHSVGGSFYPLEAHIVSTAQLQNREGCASIGCLTVVGIMFAMDDEDRDNPLLTAIFDAMPTMAGENTTLPAGVELNLDALLPSNASYVTYEGSLTTPPCSESVLWHVMLQPQTMSRKQLEQFLQATGDVECEEKQVAKKEDDRNVVMFEEIEVCQKLGAGQNYRVLMPQNERVLGAYIDNSSPTAGRTGSRRALLQEEY